MNLSKREKILLAALAVVLLWYAAMNMLLLPMNKSLQEVKSQVQVLESEKEQMQMFLDRNANVEEQLAKQRSQMENESYFYYGLDDVSVDRMLQQLADKHSVRIIAHSIAAPQEAAISPYIESSRVLSYPIGDMHDVLTGAAPAENEAAAESELTDGTEEMTDGTQDAAPQNKAQDTEEAETDVVPVISTVISVEGSVENVMMMVDEISNMDRSIRVTAAGSGAVSNLSDGTFSDTIAINFYYFDFLK